MKLGEENTDASTSAGGPPNYVNLVYENAKKKVAISHFFQKSI